MNHLVVGNKNYSSWSLRPWLLLKEIGIPFRETKISLYQQDSREQLLKFSSSAKVPVYFYKEIPIWDSLAICETIAEIYPEKHCWPQAFDLRALARSVSHEMHSGFSNIRNCLPMNCKKIMVYSPISPALMGEINRICEIWRTYREQNAHLGDFLFGNFSIADAMYAPIVLRFNSYGIKVGCTERKYMESILSLNSVKEWISDGVLEKEVIQDAEVG